MDGEAATRRLGRIGLANPPAALVGVRKQVVLAAAWHGDARLECPAKHVGAPSLRGCRDGAGGPYGSITPPQLPSSDPAATKAWCANALGWTFKPGVPLPGRRRSPPAAYSPLL